MAIFTARLLLLVAIALSLIRTLHAQSPAITHVTPGAIIPGQTTEVTFRGVNLDQVKELWATSPVAARLAGQKKDTEKSVTFAVTLPPDTQPGLLVTRLISPAGLSPFVTLIIDDLPSVTASGTNQSLGSAQPLAWPVAVDGVGEENRFHYYRFHARKGERVAVEVWAARLGSKFDPVLRLLDAQGKELAYTDDDPAIAPDCRFARLMPATGHYVLELRDMTYQGGKQFRYRLRIGDFPLVNGAHPSVAKAGETTRFTVLGREVEKLPSFGLKLAPEPGRAFHGVRLPGGRSSAFVSVLASEFPEQLEREPNDQPAGANKLSLPVAVNGMFQIPRDVDYYEFAALKDQKILFEGKTRSLGFPADLWLRLEKMDGTKLTEPRQLVGDDASFTNTFKEAGTYRLRVEELSQRSGRELAYRIEITPQAPGFAPELDVENATAPPGGAFELKFALNRRDYKGPVTFTIPGLPAGYEVNGGAVAADQTTVTLRVKVPAAAKPGTWFSTRIAAVAEIGGIQRSNYVSTLTALRKLWPKARHAPTELDGRVMFLVTTPKTDK